MVTKSKSYIAKCSRCGKLFDTEKDGKVCWVETPVTTRIAPLRAEVSLCKECWCELADGEDGISYEKLCDILKGKNNEQN